MSRVITNKDLKKQFHMKVANRIHNFGDTDFSKNLIRVNKKKSRKEGNRGELLDTIVHELNHAKHPMMKEKTVRKKTGKDITYMSRKTKQRYYKLFS